MVENRYHDLGGVFCCCCFSKLHLQPTASLADDGDQESTSVVHLPRALLIQQAPSCGDEVSSRFIGPMSKEGRSLSLSTRKKRQVEVSNDG